MLKPNALLTACAALMLATCSAAPAQHTAPLHALRSAQHSTAASAPKVRVEFYGESLCPFCIKFTLEQLAGLFKTGLADIIDLDYIASGNARPSSEGGSGGEIECQHGPLECALNRVLACGVALAPPSPPASWFPFLECVEAAAGERLRGDSSGDGKRGGGGGKFDVDGVSKRCAAQAGIDALQLRECYTGAQGDALQRRALDRTLALRPRQRWVPWVTVNGVPLLDDFENVAAYVCAAYAGSKPEHCFHGPPPDPSPSRRAAAPERRTSLAA